MPILANDLWNAMRATLGVAGTQRYLPDTNIIPAINDGLRQFNGFVYSLFAEKKGSEELLREINMTRVFQTNDMGGAVLLESQLGHKVWTINAVYPEPVFNPANAAINPIPVSESAYRPDVVMRRPGKIRCARLTQEQIPDTENSRMMPGSSAMANAPLRTAAYYLVGDRGGTDWVPSGTELVVLPEQSYARKLIVVSYMKGVDPITSLNDTVPYPPSAFELLKQLSLNAISLRQGAQPLYQVTIDSVRALLGAQG